MIPIYFEDCFGWFHPANGTRGIVICSAFGVEELITHRFIKVLADEVSAAGLPTLRFDYRGTGDSLGADTDADRVNDWLASIRHAIEWLIQKTSVSEVVLVGFRLGGLLATQASIQLGNISAVVLVGAISSGKAYVREMSTLAMINGRSLAETALGTRPHSTENIIEAVGFQLTEETQNALRKIDLLSLQQRPADKVLLLGAPESTSDNRLAEHFRHLGCTVDQQTLPGYAEFEWHAVFAKLPDNAFSGLTLWLREVGTLSASLTIPKKLPLSSLHCEGWQEQPVTFGKDLTLFGIYCRPQNGSRKIAVLFANDGPNRHIGSARMFVTLARRLSSFGIASLRMDIAGVGDSPPHPGQSINQLYYRGSQQDISNAIDWLQGEGYTSHVIIGHCAGAYLSFYATIRDPRITGLAMLNLQRFFWKRGESPESVMRNGEFRSSNWYLSMLKDTKFWNRLLRGKVNISGIAWELTQRLWAKIRNSVLLAINRLIGRESNRHKLIRWFHELSQRGTKVLMLYSAQDPGLDELALQAGSKARKILRLPNVRVNVINGADHSLTQSWAIRQYEKILLDFLL